MPPATVGACLHGGADCFASLQILWKILSSAAKDPKGSGATFAVVSASSAATSYALFLRIKVSKRMKEGLEIMQ